MDRDENKMMESQKRSILFILFAVFIAAIASAGSALVLAASLPVESTAAVAEIDELPTVQFSTSNYSASEADGTTTISVTLQLIPV